MLANRAQEIMNAREKIAVFYEGHPVWIENIEGDSAQVRLIDRGQSLKVPVNMLAEG
ncbi:H-type small acid-soluble spore protein [Syntrophomonas erecta]